MNDPLLVNCQLRLPLILDNKIRNIEGELNLSREEVLNLLVDTYYLESTTHLNVIQYQLSRRIRRGIGSAYLKHLRLLYTYLGHFLKKVGALE